MQAAFFICATSTLVFLCGASCPEGAITGLKGSKCYKIMGNGVSFYDAETTCIDEGSHLTSVNDAFESSFVKGEPSAGNNCIFLKVPSGSWATRSCASNIGFVCELPPLAAAVPATYLPPPAESSCPPSRPRCQADWTYLDHTSSCYKVFHSYLTFLEAESMCQAHDSHLSSIHDLTENDFLTGLATTGDTLADWSKLTWIGLNSLDQPWKMSWIDGTPVDFTHWYSGTSPYSGAQECTVLVSDPIVAAGNAMYWWDRDSCDKKKRAFICKRHVGI